MDIWITWCKRESKCEFCPEPVMKHTPIVIGKQWFSHGQVKKFVKIHKWHPMCWIKQGLINLENIPYVSKVPGRKKIDMPEDMRIARRKVLARRAAYIQRLRETIESDDCDHEAVVRITEKLEQLKVEIEPLGGVPEKWKI